MASELESTMDWDKESDSEEEADSDIEGMLIICVILNIDSSI